MKISENWLRESVDLGGISQAELSAKLTAAGLEVEGVEPVAPAFHGVVVAEILACEKHPDADRLRVCKVSIGGDQLLQIVCGASNARVGLKAPLACVGAELPNDLRIKLGKLRGVESQGMLCSATELGLPSAVDGLLEFPSDAPVGRSVRDYLDLDDSIFELKMTPNRSDCLGLRGISRELCALFDRASRFVDVSAAHAVTAATERKIHLHSGDDCPRYMGQSVSGIDPAAQTPLWMKERLRRSGVRSIHPVVDITNYVLLEYGQPMHGFDADQLRGDLHVRRAQPGEKLTLLDEQTVALTPEFLVVADAAQVLAIAGIMGGMDSKVTAATRNVLFEAAHFSPAVIMGKARSLGLHTDSSHRFERGVDPNLPALALARAVQLLCEIAGGAPGPVLCSEHPAALQASGPILLRASRMEQLLGLKIEATKVEQILSSLGLACEANADRSEWRVQSSSARFDISIEADLIEEIARVHGYEHIPVKLPVLSLQPVQRPEALRDPGELRRVMCARGYQEAITFAFASSLLTEQFGLPSCAIKNPLASDIDVMRPSLLPNLLQAVSQNQRRQVQRVRLFEMGRVFSADGLVEHEHIAAIATGDASAEQWGCPARPVDFYDLKGDLQALFGAGRFACRPLSAAHPAVNYLHPTRSAEVYAVHDAAPSLVGVIGQLHPKLLKVLELRQAPVLFEVAVAAVQARALPSAAALSKFPSSRRDLAVVVPEAVHFSALDQVMRHACGTQLVSLQCFDVYRGKSLPDGHKSLAISLILQEFSRTLSDCEVDATMQAVIAAIGSELGATIRA